MDQLGSVGTYFPWGENKGTTNPQDTWSFATYWQDSMSGLDYANNRYYSNAYGRFMTPDPYNASGGPSDPQSWNQYAYTRGDPVNRLDPAGMQDCPVDFCVTGTGYGSGDGSGGGGHSPQPPLQGNDPSSGYPGTPNCPPGWVKGPYGNCITAQQAWQNCYNNVQQQQKQNVESMIAFLDAAYPTWLSAGAWWGGGLGFGIGAAASEGVGAWVGAYFGAHVGLLAADQWHTLGILLLNVIANLPPLPSSVTAACGPQPGN
jgi:RHS repeat-associated protein